MNLDNEMKDMENKTKTLKSIIKMMAKVTGEPSLLFKTAIMELDDKLNSIAINMQIITNDQYKELTNIIEQFSHIINDYLIENNIELKDE